MCRTTMYTWIRGESEWHSKSLHCSRFLSLSRCSHVRRYKSSASFSLSLSLLRFSAFWSAREYIRSWTTHTLWRKRVGEENIVFHGLTMRMQLHQAAIHPRPSFSHSRMVYGRRKKKKTTMRVINEQLLPQRLSGPSFCNNLSITFITHRNISLCHLSLSSYTHRKPIIIITCLVVLHMQTFLMEEWNVVVRRCMLQSPLQISFTSSGSTFV